MKKVILLSVLFFTQTSLSMSSFGGVIQAVQDKWDRTGVMEELDRNGVNQNLDTRITQQHRLARLIRDRVQKEQTKELCDDIAKIKTRNYPISPLADEMALNFLEKMRKSLRGKDPLLLSQVITAIDRLRPMQIVQDLADAEYMPVAVDGETRMTTVGYYLLQRGSIDDIMALVGALDVRSSTMPEAQVVPTQRVLCATYAKLRQQEKEIKKNKRILKTIFGVQKNDSDSDADLEEGKEDEMAKSFRVDGDTAEEDALVEHE